MTRRTVALGLALCLLAACDDRKAAEIPKPFALTAEAMGHYCGMNVLEHPGPKGQVLLKSRIDPVWFSSVRDTLAFTMLPDEPKDILAVYVSDMGMAPSWERPGAENWVEARAAWFVVNSAARGGMGVDEVVPFSKRQDAERFSAEKGGKVVAFAAVPQDAVLSGVETPGSPGVARGATGGPSEQAAQ
jgi:copper chaperone NosL